MCCRYYMELSPELRPFVEAAKRSPLTERMVEKLSRPLVSSGEVRPTSIVPVIAPTAKRMPAVFPMVWGFSGKTAPLVNARSETAAVKPTFRESWEKRRCVIPASWYYEWEHLVSPEGRTKTGAKYAIQPKGAHRMFLAGLYRLEERGGFVYPAFAVLTREPTEELRRIHDRMPVILPEKAVADWIDPQRSAEELLAQALWEMEIEKAKS